MENAVAFQVPPTSCAEQWKWRRSPSRPGALRAGLTVPLASWPGGVALDQRDTSTGGTLAASKSPAAAVQAAIIPVWSLGLGVVYVDLFTAPMVPPMARRR